MKVQRIELNDLYKIAHVGLSRATMKVSLTPFIKDMLLHRAQLYLSMEKGS